MTTEKTHQETLSALFDGELRDDEARFALKRLQHDAEARAALERWQLLGDALRGQATAPMPREFATRVTSAVAQEHGSTAHRSPRWRHWAMAASVAAVALLFARQTQNDVAPKISAPTQAVSVPAPEIITAPVESRAPETETTPAISAAQRVATSRESTSRESTSRTSTRPVRRVPAAVDVQAEAVAVAEPAVPSASPFATQTDPPSRPWPRALLPGASTQTFTVGYGGSESSPSFYPFEPRLQEPQNDSNTEPSNDESATQ